MMAGMNRAALVPDPAVLEAFDLLPGSAQPAPLGLINRTWYVSGKDGRRLVLQHVSGIFPPEINQDIDVLTGHLAAKGLLTPRVVPTRDRTLWFDHAGGRWRVLTRVEGLSRHALQNTAQAREAGRVLATFHRAVADLAYTFKNARLGVHDTQRHLGALRTAIAELPSHPEHPSVSALAQRVFALADRLPRLPASADRIVHGDPKISNIMFEPATDRALCLIDLDTLTRMPVALELGDALRSWCNPVSEDAAAAGFSRPLFQAAIEGYAAAAGGLLQTAEWTAIPAATLTISVELAARFCTDSLREDYFGWDATRHPSASAHNQARTRNQLQVAENVLLELESMHEATALAFSR
jgi:Ser/Thr protein kinase RdoA (MazF antagonist)